jgi:hypothetical protein
MTCKVTYTCDKCGTEMSSFYVVRCTHRQYTNGLVINYDSDTTWGVDICEACYKKFLGEPKN